MDRVHEVLVHLEPVAGVVDGVGQGPVVRHLIGVEGRKGRLVVRRAQVGEDQALVFESRIGAVNQVVLDFAARGLSGRVQDRAVHVVEPAVVTAADAALGHDPELQGGAAMAAVAMEQADLAGAIPKRH
jgi:hypothetical protein